MYLYFGDNAISDEGPRLWFLWIKSGNECSEAEQHQGRTQTCINEEIKHYLVKKNIV